MNDKRSERRSETAKRHDDSDIIESGPPTPDKVGRSGGNMQRDVATADAEKRVRDPEARDRFTKEQEVEHGGSSTARPKKGAT